MEEYTNRELYIMMKGQKSDIIEMKKDIGEKLDFIIKKQKEMNGNVQHNTEFRWKTTGALVIISSILLPTFLYVLQDFFRITNLIITTD